MSLFDLNADLAKNLSVGAIVSSIFTLLIVLKFASSLVTKLLLIGICCAVGYVGFTQRDSLNACIEVATAQAKSGEPVATTCKLLGQNVRVRLPSLPSQG
ncbi:MAG: hypothetical protein ABR76_03220 [Acidimicrobiia bacterium BACL6 MAG-121220-bin61]|uniref:Uncharacterized protein n=1 Tax=Acidimicrobiia bacterium BACL6 MAG-120924-bin43 TaxID=1655583 RepID=A0A0R2QDY9_9ACTN|nr:MAG: hypothetical protein ABR75_03590 [Acidimicrobiia bacterium BACL6 MAG-120924-bin43]KRO53054.1 MAG: hypothetical protein ABR78_01330 [Acidimicrobiia bacterium BACL6 MAG-120910-bin40]KRO58084.1 MAG: hypothetical protein ABR77_08920 [Acidimicrobiia bacterium BACL6 MAG-120322-bin79]KRO63659.1 MAG: hypothetical protein ABR76_03220 [Acidimicrobiia bacterium BACL6 MAG-121220-bin61]HAG68217.1 hypothetical protein [Acidimicrobium sp.]